MEQNVQSPPPSTSKYDNAINSVWSSLAKLADLLTNNNANNRSANHRTLEQLIATTKNHLQQGNQCINWAKIADTEIIPALRRSAGMKSLTFGLGVWIVVLLALTAASSFIVDIFIVDALIAGAIVFVISSWLKKYRVDSFLDNTKTRVMYFAKYNEQAEYPYSYDCLLLDMSAIGLNSIITQISYANISQLGINKSIGVFTNEGLPIAFIPVGDRAQLINVLGQQEFNLGYSILGPGFEKYENQQSELISRWSELENRIPASERSLNLNSSRDKWDAIVLEPNTLEHILRAWMLFSHGEKSAPRGLLFKGPPGTGKSMIASIFSETSGAHFLKLSVGDIKGSHIGESAANVIRIWNEARNKQPMILFIDECEGVFVKRGSDQGDSFTNELVQTFLTEWDGIGENSHVLVIGATNRPDLIDDAVMSRFTDVIDLQPVSNEFRTSLIQSVARQIGLKNAIPPAIMEQMGGLSGRDLKNVLQQTLRFAAPDEPKPIHFENAISRVRGKGSTKTDSSANWDSLVLDDETEQRLKVTCHMVKDAEALVAKGIPVTRTIMLYGPPGTGKTQIARTIANEAGVSFISRTTADFKGQYLGQAASRISQTFESARSQSPCILFIDEIDALTSSRQGSSEDQLQNEALVQLLQELDGVSDKKGFVLVVAATNQLHQIDGAILSRFSQKFEIALPNAIQRAQLLRILLTNKPVATGIDIENLAYRCTDFSGRDLRELVTDGFNSAVERTLKTGHRAAETTLQPEDIEKALERKIVNYTSPYEPALPATVLT